MDESSQHEAFLDKIRKETQYKVGKFTFSNVHRIPESDHPASKRLVVNVVFIPSRVLKHSHFSFDPLFAELGLQRSPEIVFQLNKAPKVKEWNLKLTGELKNIKNTDPKDPRINELELEHYQAVIEGNCVRLFDAISSACTAANAIYRLSDLWSPKYPVEYVGKWAKKSNAVPLLSVVGINQLDPNFLRTVWNRMFTTGDAKNETTPPAEFDILPFVERAQAQAAEGKFELTIPHTDATHVFLTDDFAVLDDKFRESIPVGLILVNGGVAASTAFNKSVENQTPIFLFRHTGGFADLTTAFLKCVRNDIELDVPYKVFRLKEGCYPDSDTPEASKWLKPFKKGDKLITCAKSLNVLAFNTTSASKDYLRHSVIEIDCFGTSKDRIQDKVTKAMSVAFNGRIEIGGQKSDEDRLDYAWKLRYLVLFNYEIQQLRANRIWACVVIFTLLSTVMPVIKMYLELEEPMSYEDNEDKVVLLNLVFPFIATFFRGVFSYLTPDSKASIFKTAAVRIENDIYSYRSKTGPYSRLKKSPPPETGGKDSKESSASVEKVIKPSKLFSKNLSSILSSLSVQTIQKDGMYSPPVNSNVFEDINQLISADTSNEELCLYSIEDEDSEGEDEKQPLLTDAPKHKHSVTNIIASISGAPPTVGSVHPLVEGESGFESEPIARPVNANHKHVTVLMADDYIRQRLRPKLTMYNKQAPKLSKNVNYSGFGVIFLSVVAATFTPLELVVWIPMVLAVSAALSSWTTHKSEDIRLTKLNFAINQLNTLLVWWAGLNVIEKRSTSNKERLVQQAESIIMQAELPEGNAGSNEKKKKKESDGDGDNSDRK